MLLAYASTVLWTHSASQLNRIAEDVFSVSLLLLITKTPYNANPISADNSILLLHREAECVLHAYLVLFSILLRDTAFLFTV